MFSVLFCLEFLLILCRRLPRPVAYCSDVPVNAAAALCVRVMGSSVAFTSYRLVACEEYLADKRFYAESIIDRVFRGYFNKFRVRRFVFAFLACFLLASFLLQSTLHDHGEDDAAAASSSPAANGMNDFEADVYEGYVGGRPHACVCIPIFLNFMVIVVVAVVLVMGRSQPAS